MVSTGLMNPGNFSHVNAALQALLHIPEVVSFLEEDEDHRKSCRSLLCASCALYNTMSSLKAKKSITPTFFIEKWKRISRTLTDSKKNDPHEALFLFLTSLRLEHASRRKGMGKVTSLYDLKSTLTSALFGRTHVVRVSCQACGSISLNEEFLSVELGPCTQNLPTEIWNKFNEVKEHTCSSCSRMKAEWKPESVTYPPYLLVNAPRSTLEAANIFSIKVNTEMYNLHLCITQGMNSLQSVCTIFDSDGVIRQFADGQVKRVSLATFLMGGLAPGCTSVFLFRKKSYTLPNFLQSGKRVSVPPTNIQEQIGKRHQGFKVVALPKITDPSLLTEGLSRRRTIGTQTDPFVVPTQDIGVQNDLLDFEKLKDQPECDFKFWTGINVMDFQALYNLIGGDSAVMRLKQKYRPDSPTKIVPSKISGRNRLLLFFIRFRQGLTLKQLAFAFRISPSYAGELFYVMTGLLHETFKALSANMFASAADQNKNKPKVMKPFKNLRVIVDGVSFFHETPSNFEHQGNTWSAYKHHNVMLFIVGISCQGATIFCSAGMEGGMSDKKATVKSELIPLCDGGDAVMADKGFELTQEMVEAGVKLLKPPIKRKDRYFTKEEEKLTRAIAAARIYVEHAMADIKDNSLLTGVIPLTLLPILSKLVYIGAYMRNFASSRIHDITLKAAKASVVPEEEVEDLIFGL